MQYQILNCETHLHVMVISEVYKMGRIKLEGGFAAIPNALLE